MKKTFFFLACLTALNVASQVTPTGTVQITKAGPLHPPLHTTTEYICTGDTMVVSFKFTFSGTVDNSPGWNFHFINYTTNIVTPLQTFSYSEFYRMNKALSGIDTIYSFKYQVPANFSAMDAIGNITIETGGTYLYPGKSVNIQHCDVTGIQEYFLNDSPPVYYDLQGNKIEPRKNEFIIKEMETINHEKIRKIILDQE